jgi:putative ABC transport system permease protein
MNTQIKPILASLRKHRIPAVLIVLEIALACAVLCNAVFMIGTRMSDMHLPNAIDEASLSVITVYGDDPKLAKSDIPRNLEALRQIPGVQGVAVMNTAPLTNNGWNSNFTAADDPKAEGPNTAEYFIGAGADEVLGLQLKQGRLFTSDEYADGTIGSSFLPEKHVVVVTQSLAARMWPGESPVGKKMYASPYWYEVVGVVGDVLRPNRQGEGANSFYFSAFFPVQPGDAMSYYIVRSTPQDRQHVIDAAEKLLGNLDVNAVAKGRRFSDMRDAYFANTRSMVWMLALVCVVMLAVTAFGIVGLTSFWVGQRRRQIGIRRAVGATRGHIMQYFQTENFLLSTTGVLLGMGLAFGINAYLMRHYEMDRMPWYYLPIGAVALWTLGQLAVLGPALRAAAVPPVVATRSV